MSRLPTLAILALVIGSHMLIASATSYGHGDAETPATPAAAEVDAVNDHAHETAPDAIGDTCGSTLPVEGMGRTCVTSDGSLLVEQHDGEALPIHELDAPPSSASTFASRSVIAVNGADVHDIDCAAADARGYQLVYAHPAGQPSRVSEIAPQLRTAAYQLSAYVDAESRSVDPTKGQHVPFRCANGQPSVIDAPLLTLTSATATFGAIVDALRAQGYQYGGSGSNDTRYLVYFDAPSTTGAAGTGHVFTSDARASTENRSNVGGLYAVQYRFDGGGESPRWDVLLHELMHTMGAVADAAPHTSGGGHCNDGLDVMCYADGGPASAYTTDGCALKLLDCRRDDYFNPSPGAGSYLADHWNTAAPTNLWLDHRALEIAASPGGATTPTTTSPVSSPGAGSPPPDRVRPTAPGLPRLSNVHRGVAVRWPAARDNVRVTTYAVYRHVGRRWQLLTTVRNARFILPASRAHAGRAVRLRVHARDAAGNESRPSPAVVVRAG